MTLAAVILVALLAVSTALLVAGLRGRRLDDHPNCRKCRFDLIGLPRGEGRCPECGADLAAAKAVRVGNRRRSIVATSAGACGIALIGGAAVTLAWASISRFDWNTVKPNWWLLRETQPYSVWFTSPSLHELLARLNDGRLERAEASVLVGRALRVQAGNKQGWFSTWGDVVEVARDKGFVTDEDWARYARQAVSLKLLTRNYLRPGDFVPLRINQEFRVGSGRRFDMFAWACNATFEGRASWTATPDTPGAWGGPRLHAIGFLSTPSGSDQPWDIRPWGAPSERATIDFPRIATGQPSILNLGVRLAVREHVGYGRGPRSDEWPPANSIAAWDVPLAVMVCIAPDPTAPIGGFVADSVDPEERPAFRVESAKFSAPGQGMPRLTVGVEATNEVRIPFAFDVLARAEGVEHLLGRIVGDGNVRPNTRLYVNEDAPWLRANTIDVILRPSTDAAFETVTITSIWGEEIVLSNVPVKRDQP